MYRFWCLLLLVGLVVGVAGCAVTGVQGSNSQITVANAFKAIQAASSPVTLKAVGSNSQPIAVSWSLTHVNQDCAPTCGTLVPSVLGSAIYTPPANPPVYGQATITVQSGSNIWVNDFQITDALDVSIINKFSTQFTSGPQVLIAVKVLHDPANAGVTWSLTAGGANCAPACGTLTPGTGSPVLTATYQPPSAVPSGANASPTITVTSVTQTTKSDSFSFTIVSSLTLLKGSYALLLRGYYLAGSPMALAGSITADGNGNITNGEFDIDNGGGITLIKPAATGTYTIDLSFNGAFRGRIAITSFTFPGSNNGLGFDFVLSADGKRGRVVEADGSAYINSGTLLLQDPAALASGHPAGTYVFGLDSDEPVGGRIVEAGRFVLASSGVSGGVFDRSVAGYPAPFTRIQLSSGAVTGPDSSGRGTLTLAIEAQGGLGAESVLYAYYVVNSDQLNLVEIDAGTTTGVQAGVAYVQKVPASPQTTSVLQLTGMDAIPAANCTAQQQPNCIAPDVIIGVLNITAGSSFTLTFDENDAGTVLTKHIASGTVILDPDYNSTGRGTFSDPGGFENGFMDSAVFYLYDTGKGFLIDSDISTCVITTSPCNPPVPPSGPITNNAFSGTFVPQATRPFSASSVGGNLIFGSGASAIPDIPDVVASAAADNAAGTLSALGDVDSLPSQDGNLQNYAFGGTYSLTDANLGYGSATLPSFLFGVFTPPSTPAASFYIIAPNQSVLIGTQNGLFSGISFFDPP